MTTQADHYSLDAVLDRVDELHITVNGHNFAIYRGDRGETVARCGHERHHFWGCSLDEIKTALEVWRPGDWK